MWGRSMPPLTPRSTYHFLPSSEAWRFLEELFCFSLAPKKNPNGSPRLGAAGERFSFDGLPPAHGVVSGALTKVPENARSAAATLIREVSNDT